MLYLKKLEFGAIRSFRDKQVINFSNKGMCTQIGGENLDTGGSSGAAKSTIPKSIDYLLNISDIPATILQNWDTDEPMFVRGTFEKDGETVVFTRKNKGGVTLVVGDKEYSGASKEVEAVFDDLIQGIPRDIFRKMYHKRQGEKGFFLSLTPKESYNFMMRAVDLEEWERKMDAAKKKIESIKPDIASVETKLESEKKDLENINELISMDKEPPEPDLKSTLGLEKNLKKLEKETDKLLSEKEKELSKIQKPESTVVSNPFEKELSKIKDDLLKIQEKKNSIRKELDPAKVSAENKIEKLREERTLKYTKAKILLQEVENKIKICEAAESQEIVYKDKAKKLAAELKHLQGEECPTCLREWKDAGFENKKKELKEQLLALKKKIEKCAKEYSNKQKLEEERDIRYKELDNEPSKEENEAIDKLVAIDKKIAEVTEKLSEATKKLETKREELKDKYADIVASSTFKHQNKLNEYNDLINSIKRNYDSKIESLNEKASKIREEINTEKIKQKYFLEAIEVYKERMEKLSTKKVILQESLSNLESKIAKKKKNLDLAEESYEAIKSYTMKVFQDTLDTISATATDMLQKVPNTQSKIITFESFKEQKNGKIKEEITANISGGSRPEVDIRSLSGGERSSVDLAVDLAVLQVLEDRFNKGMDLFFLDEPFDGLDTVSKEQYLEVLKNVNISKKLFIVDHSTEVQEMVDDTITVFKENDVSWIEKNS